VTSAELPDEKWPAWEDASEKRRDFHRIRAEAVLRSLPGSEARDEVERVIEWMEAVARGGGFNPIPATVANAASVHAARLRAVLDRVPPGGSEARVEAQAHAGRVMLERLGECVSEAREVAEELRKDADTWLTTDVPHRFGAAKRCRELADRLDRAPTREGPTRDEIADTAQDAAADCGKPLDPDVADVIAARVLALSPSEPCE
jgi:hypothetical protein